MVCIARLDGCHCTDWVGFWVYSISSASSWFWSLSGINTGIRTIYLDVQAVLSDISYVPV
ncbi:uncharacterized protein LY89DRAFT_124374 [Mollisia scopiformis]|uniref:Uncharacterized protein n=1 Tax=Mollisia scopiformis TaxID=149040 RepID=A0A194X508_MOLSC|nr:uncharacterized protein LY89DRAFT_124374 [Mollisia scopiformis]KUJ14887.1 hypothetical protein LY89DRAFT_124374 [Mollisia scopiformis]